MSIACDSCSATIAPFLTNLLIFARSNLSLFLFLSQRQLYVISEKLLTSFLFVLDSGPGLGCTPWRLRRSLFRMPLLYTRDHDSTSMSDHTINHDARDFVRNGRNFVLPFDRRCLFTFLLFMQLFKTSYNEKMLIRPDTFSWSGWWWVVPSFVSSVLAQ